MMTVIVMLKNGSTVWIPTKVLSNTKPITFVRLLQGCLANRIFFIYQT